MEIGEAKGAAGPGGGFTGVPVAGGFGDEATAADGDAVGIGGEGNTPLTAGVDGAAGVLAGVGDGSGAGGELAAGVDSAGGT